MTLKNAIFLSALAILGINSTLKAQTSTNYRVLFIGNSYTHQNDLPNLIKNIALAENITISHSSSTPGGSTFTNHTNNQTTLNLINQGNWDYVVLQGQSQEPSFPDNYVQNNVYPPARELDSLIHVANPCARTVFYMTWGRENGDASNCNFFAPLCTYEGMDSVLQLRYTNMMHQNEAWMSPVAKVWRAFRANYATPTLYSGDESHPSLTGSYLAGLTFYTVMTGNNPIGNTYNPGINATVMTNIQQLVKSIVFDSLANYRAYNPLPSANFDVDSQANLSYQFNYTGANSPIFYKWQFGDGSTSSDPNPIHTYAQQGTYDVCVTAGYECDTVTYCNTITIGGNNTSVKNVIAPQFTIVPTMVHHSLLIKGVNVQNAVDYQIYNVMGQMMKSGVLKNGNMNITDLDQLTSGVYTIQLQTKSQSLGSAKFIKE